MPTLSRHSAVRTLLALYLVGAVSLGPAVASTALDGQPTPVETASAATTGGIDEDLLNESTNTTETVENTTDDTTETVENTTDDSAETIEDTTETVENTTDDTTDTVENTTDTLENATEVTVEDTTDTLENTTDAMENTTEATVDATADLLGVTTTELLVGVDVFFVDGSSSGTDDTTRTTTPASSESTPPTRTADRNASVPAGGSNGDDGVPMPAALGAGAVVAGAAGAAALSAGGGATGSAGALRSGASGVRSAVRHPRSLLSGLGDRLWKLGAILRYSRWDDSDPLEHDRRREVFDTVEDHPGIYLSKLDDETDGSLSSLRHHLRILEEENLLTTEKVRGKRRYFPVQRGADDPALLAALDDPATEPILRTLADVGPASGGELAEALDRDASTISHHLSRLEDEGLVVRERDGRSVVNRLSETAALALEDVPTATTEPAAPADD